MAGIHRAERTAALPYSTHQPGGYTPHSTISALCHSWDFTAQLHWVMPQRVWSGPHEKAELCYRQVTMIPTILWKNNCKFCGLNEDKSLNQMVLVHNSVCSSPLNRYTLSPGWVQEPHRQDSHSMSSAHNSNLPGRGKNSQSIARLHTQQSVQNMFVATKHYLRSVRKGMGTVLCRTTTDAFDFRFYKQQWKIYSTFGMLQLYKLLWFPFSKEGYLLFIMHSVAPLIRNRPKWDRKYGDVPLA